MRLSIVAVLFSFSCAVVADFDLYQGQFFWSGIKKDSMHEVTWKVFQAEPDCNDVDTTPRYDFTSDVSGDKIGVRCEGRSGCMGNNDPAGIEILEMHFSNDPLYHWTIYRDRGNYEMIGLDGKVYGHCDPFPGDDYHCLYGTAFNFGNRKFRCYTRFTAADINSAFLGDR